MIVLDASVWVSIFLASDVHHAESYRWSANSSRNLQIVVDPVIVLPEIVGAIARRGSKQKYASKILDDLASDPLLSLMPIDIHLSRHAADLAASLTLRGADSIYVALAEFRNIPLITWDKEQLERGGQVVRALTPEQAFAELL